MNRVQRFFPPSFISFFFFMVLSCTNFILDGWFASKVALW